MRFGGWGGLGFRGLGAEGVEGLEVRVCSKAECKGLTAFARGVEVLQRQALSVSHRGPEQLTRSVSSLTFRVRGPRLVSISSIRA